MAKIDYNSLSALSDKWFKIQYTSRKTSETDYSFSTGENKYFVKYDVQNASGTEYLIDVEPISYRSMIKMLNKKMFSKELV